MQPAFKRFTIDPAVPFGYSFTFYVGTPRSQATVDLTEASGLLTVVDGDGSVLMTLSSSPLSNNSPSPVRFPGPFQLPSSGGTGIYFGGQGNDPTNGVIGLVISPEDIALIDWQYANYNLILTTESLGVQNLLHGSFAVVGFLP